MIKVEVLDTSARIDAQIMDELTGIDWHSVSEREAAEFGVALGSYRDKVHACDTRRAAYWAMAGGCLSMLIVGLVVLLMGLKASDALGAVAVTQTARTLWLGWKKRQAEREVRLVEDRAVQLASDISQAHPAKP